MAKKARSRVLDYAVYLAVRGLVCVVQAVPVSMALGVAELLAKFAYRVDKRHRAVAADNLRHAFPDLDDAGIDRLVRGCYAHFCRLFVEMILVPRKFNIQNWRSFATMVDSVPLVRGLLSDEPLLIVTAHFGNWEVAGYLTGAIGFRTYAIARVLDNPHLEKFLKRFRQHTGQTIIAKKDDFERLTKVLGTGGKLATLGDQDAGPRGVFVDFFNRPASAHKAVAMMAMAYKAKMVVVGVPRVGDPMKYDVVVADVIDPQDYATRTDAVKAITQRYHDAIAKLVRQYPEQYFWLHRRWKTQPGAKKPKSA